MLVPCPSCGRREELEFDVLSSEPEPQPDGAPAVAVEVWHHRDGCTALLHVRRDLRADRLLLVTRLAPATASGTR